MLELADELYQRGRSSGEGVDYGEFEERMGRAAAEAERGVHHVALRGLDVDAPFIRIWGKHYRRVHRVARTYASLAGPMTIERTRSTASKDSATLLCSLRSPHAPTLRGSIARERETI